MSEKKKPNIFRPAVESSAPSMPATRFKFPSSESPNSTVSKRKEATVDNNTTLKAANKMKYPISKSFNLLFITGSMANEIKITIALCIPAAKKDRSKNILNDVSLNERA